MVGDVKDKTAIIFDDEVETAGTLIEAAHVVKKAGSKRNLCSMYSWITSWTCH